MGRSIFKYPLICVLFLFSVTLSKDFKDLAKESDDQLVLFSTNDGSLIAVEQQTGNIKWETVDEPTVTIYGGIKEASVSLFLPDPKDGYPFRRQKLPFTIPQLVTSPTWRSSDGILYTGRKKDTWFIMDPETGSRQEIPEFEKLGSICPVTAPNAVYGGRTQYTIMIDARGRHCNITLYDYTASPMNKEMQISYGLLHFTNSSTGKVVTWDQRINQLLWEIDLGSPVVAVYILNSDGFFIAPLITLDQLAPLFSTHEHSRSTQPTDIKIYFGTHRPITTIAEHLPGGLIRIGQITYNPENVLGKGCGVTFVYRGKFNNQDVAVKRMLIECFADPDREIYLLNELINHNHPNVIRYFGKEQDHQFIYLALELCAATVQDYVEGRYDVSLITPLEILKQATSGLAHLHSLGIIHRDIKPPNVLLSMPNDRGEVRAMISDLGLSRKLKDGKFSLSRSSGVVGTVDWMAPEMLNRKGRNTCAVDIFSLGCLFYYVLSKGQHPFGEHRLCYENILAGKYTLSKLKGVKFRIETLRMLISNLISVNADDRPPATSVLLDPVFWDNARIFGFFHDVSASIQRRLLMDDPVNNELQALDCLKYMIPEVPQELLQYRNDRNYRGKCVRDLLCAIQNLEQHYRELSPEAQDSLGSIADQFTIDCTSRFHLLLFHSWIAMQCVQNETMLQNYNPPDQWRSQDVSIDGTKRHYNGGLLLKFRKIKRCHMRNFSEF